MSYDTKFDPEERELKKLMGNRFVDLTGENAAFAGLSNGAVQNPTAAEDDTYKPEDAEWKPIKPTPNQLDKLKWCAIAIAFGVLTIMISNWEQAALMDASIAVPSMCVCAALFGVGIGKTTVKG